MGNYFLTLFAHVSGEMEIISGRRAWARLNAGERRNRGNNRAVIHLNGAAHPLTGIPSAAADPDICRRTFGCGFAEYDYRLDGVRIRRTLSVRPSDTPYDGTPAFLLSLRITNESKEALTFSYTEELDSNYREIRLQGVRPEDAPVRYAYHAVRYGEIAAVRCEATSDDPLLLAGREARAPYDVFPPALFVAPCPHADGGLAAAECDGQTLRAGASGDLLPGETAAAAWIVGFSEVCGEGAITGILADMERDLRAEDRSAWSSLWRERIPSFADEADDDLRREMQWHVYHLEAMATYSDYYEETKIPQGTIYDYDWGVHASARDDFQHALPLTLCHPALAKSVLRYLLKRTTSFGEIRLIEYGCGEADNERYFTSDQQLFFFYLLAEYLRNTKDDAFLMEEVCPYPYRGTSALRVFDLVRACFTFLRDQVGTGPHGLIRLLNSDWNDAVFYINRVPYNHVVLEGESHMNSAMALAILPRLRAVLERAASSDALADIAEEVRRLSESVRIFYDKVLRAYLSDWGGNAFPARMYFDGRLYGRENMFLEPQGYTLMAEDIPIERKRRLYAEMEKRLYAGEKLGAREQEVPEFEDAGFDKGSRENGGFWWALNGPVILGVAAFDRARAEMLLKRMTLWNMENQFPEYWSSYWSAADNQESSLLAAEGLPDQSLTYSDIPICCAHPHAWILYCYLYLRNMA